MVTTVLRTHFAILILSQANLPMALLDMQILLYVILFLTLSRNVKEEQRASLP